jgi:large conductance mechanosensitive channel
MKILKEFKDFALKGNVIDMAVGIIIGVAFGLLVKSVVDDLLMPPIGFLIGGLDFSEYKYVLQAAGAVHPVTGVVIEKETAIYYGKFINAIITFLIQAMAIFIVVKVINSAKRKPQAVPDQPTPLTKDQELLSEIRDLLIRK